MNTLAAFIRFEHVNDLVSVRHIYVEAFGGAKEARLVEALRRSGQTVTSLVAERDHTVIGHLLLTPVALMPRIPGLSILGLGPVAVLPNFQRQGVGSMLIEQAIAQAETDGWHAIVVLGDPSYYARFGFKPASPFGLGCEFITREESFMVLELQPGSLKGLRGVIRYQPEFVQR